MKEHELIRAQEKFIGALLRSPGSVAVVRVAGLTTSYFPPRLAGAFEFALKGDRDRDQTLRSVLEGGEMNGWEVAIAVWGLRPNLHEMRMALQEGLAHLQSLSREGRIEKRASSSAISWRLPT